jgi:hypothetical protein
MSGPITRRQALAELTAAGALLLAGCSLGAGSRQGAAKSGSTLRSTWADPLGEGILQPAAGEPLIARTELGQPAATGAVLATLAHVTDAHVLDASSPARVTFLNRLGPPFQSTFRPHETLTTQVLDGAVRAVRALAPDAVIQGGDLIDNDQANELEHALSVLRGGITRPGSGPRGYFGVQLASDPDPFYYRPDLDAPRHPGMLSRAVAPFTSAGLAARWMPVLGDHDVLVAGELAPTQLTRALARGNRALWELPPGLQLPPGVGLAAVSSPDGPPAAGLVHSFLEQALAGPTIRVPADTARRELDVAEVLARLSLASGVAVSGARLDYHLDVGPGLRVIALDLVQRGGGSGGVVAPGQPAWLERELATAGQRWVLVVSHQPIASSLGGEQLFSVLDQHQRVLAVLAGHVHRNEIVPRPTSAGGYWLIATASLIDFPQQARALRLLATDGGGAALQTWMLDHVTPGDLGQISRELAYLDAQGGRPNGFAGDRLDRNVTLYRRGP